MSPNALVLDGRWTLHPGDTADGTPAGVEDLPGRPIVVPGLWEAQGLVHLDGVAWYVRTFELPDHTGEATYWRIRFDAVMDSADVWVNGQLVGGQELLPYTPFEVDVTAAVRTGVNTLAVRVDDPPRDDPRVPRSAHGKQGWFNEVFPSPPSLYATYGGIWQSVTLSSHGAVTIEDVAVDPDPDALSVRGEVVSRREEPWTGRLTVRAAGLVGTAEVTVPAGGRVAARVDLGATTAARWTPTDPVLHEVRVQLSRDGADVGGWTGRVGLRTIRVDGSRLLLNGRPLRMRAALVQGFWAGSLYAAPGREQIEAEVAAARDAGFNTLRLHVKAFEPAYLDVCDETGMLVHCDIPVAEPIDHDDLGSDTELARRCLAAVEAQVRRDRNHPSVILWSAMNEIGLGRPSSRATDAYEAFARALCAAVRTADPTRPVIENDWVEPDPDRVFTGDVLTAHWYGRLQTAYLGELARKAGDHAGPDRPLLVTEFGDWGLPELEGHGEPAFWWQGARLSEEIAATAWSGTVAEFVTGTQRYQGLADRLQGEVLRRHDDIAGYCLTELTDVPYELNGILDLDRRPKPAALDEVRRLNQPVLPMAALDTFTVEAGTTVTVPLHVANDGPGLESVALQATLGSDDGSGVDVGDLPAHRATDLGPLVLAAPTATGDSELRLVLTARGRVVATNRYPVWVVRATSPAASVDLVGSGPTEPALRSLGVATTGGAVLLVAEDALDDAVGRGAASALAAGRTVVVLHQEAAHAGSYPVPVRLVPTHPQWGPTVFQFTTATPPWPSLPPRRLLATEHVRVEGTAVLDVGAGSALEAASVVVGAYRPPPETLVGAVVTEQRVGHGRLVLCQLRLARATVDGEPAARALLGDLVTWAAAGTPAG